jgi:hypothetical protein
MVLVVWEQQQIMKYLRDEELKKRDGCGPYGRSKHTGGGINITQAVKSHSRH